MNVKEELQRSISDYCRDLGVSDISVSMSRTESPELGEYATPVAFALGKILKQNPFDIAQKLALFLEAQKLPFVAHAQAAAPGFVNISLAHSFFENVLRESIDSSRYGATSRDDGTVWAIEHTSPNPNKAMHLGHLRNNLIGMSIGRILEHSGARVIYETVDNNRGIAIAKMMWGYLVEMRKEKGEFDSYRSLLTQWDAHRDLWHTPEERGTTPDRFVSQCYLVGSEASKAPERDAEMRDIVVLWEAKDLLVWRLWEYVLAYSYEGMNRTLHRLGNRWDIVWHEHEHYEEGKRYVEEGLTNGVFQKLEDGAVLTNLEAYGIPDTILLKRDGTSLYITQDIALAARKKAHHHADHLVYVVGPDQSLALKQLFAVCEQLGIGARDQFTHVSYGYVGLRGDGGVFEKMSSREGTVVLIDDVIDAVRDVIRTRIDDTHADADTKAELLARAAVKFSILKTERTHDIMFDVERATDTKGDSGVYVMYTYVRTHALLRKMRAQGKDIQVGSYASSPVGKLLLYFPEACQRAREDLSPHHIAQYLLELSGAFNRWYNEEIILDGTEMEADRMALVRGVQAVLEEGCSLLGIEMIDEM